MTYTYRNKKTGEEIVTSNRVTGKNWEPVDEEDLYTTDDMQDPFEDVFDDGPAEGTTEEPTEEAAEAVPAEESPAAEPPVLKAKTSRKGKK